MPGFGRDPLASERIAPAKRKTSPTTIARPTSRRRSIIIGPRIIGGGGCNPIPAFEGEVMFGLIYIPLNGRLIKISQRPSPGGTDSRPGDCLQSQFPGIQDARRIESVLDSTCEVHSGPELLAHEVRELHPDSVDVFHGATQHMSLADQRIERPRNGRLQTPACDPPRGGHNLLCPGESQVERGRARLAAPGEGRGLERLLEIHDAGCQSVVIEPAECRESGREVLQAERVNLLRLRDGERTKGGAGHDAERPFRTDEETLEIQARRGSGGGPGSDHAPIREDGFESQDLVSHRPAKITGVADAVRPDRSANGGPGPGPGIVSQGEPPLPEPTVQYLQYDPGLDRRGTGSGID